MLVAALASFLGLILTTYAALGASLDSNILKRTAWLYGHVRHEAGINISVAVGLRGTVAMVDCSQVVDVAACARALSNSTFHEVDSGVFERVVPWTDTNSCVASMSPEDSRSSQHAMVRDDIREACESCRDVATASVVFAIMGAVTQIPQMLTDLQRATTFGDVNCQATLGIVSSLVGTLTTLSSLGAFYQGCTSNLPNYGHAGNDVVSFSWHMGAAFSCFVIATLMKLLDVCAHVLVPTPQARHSIPDEDLELVDYLRLGVDDLEKDACDSGGNISEGNHSLESIVPQEFVGKVEVCQDGMSKLSPSGPAPAATAAPVVTVPAPAGTAVVAAELKADKVVDPIAHNSSDVV